MNITEDKQKGLDDMKSDNVKKGMQQAPHRSLFNALGFPHMGTGDRDIGGQTHRYQKKEGMSKVMKDEELLERHGDIGTFVIRVQHRQHSSWQGRVTYLEKDQTVYFRSALELIKIIDGTLNEIEQADGTNRDEVK